MKGLIILFAAAAISSCAAKQEGCTTTVAPIAADSTQSFATGLLRTVYAASGQENVCVSPASAKWAMAMTVNGASGTTATEIFGTLGYPIDEELLAGFNSRQLVDMNELEGAQHAQVNIANSIWVKEGIEIKPTFACNGEKFYNAAIKNNSFDAKGIKEINDWCSEKTNGKINSILSKPAPGTQALLVNTLHFKARWAKPFNKAATEEQPFTKADGTKAGVPMMYSSPNSPYYEDSIMQATAKPFEGGEYSMLLILPTKGTSTAQCAEHFAQIYGKEFLKGKWCNVVLKMPRFECSFSTSLKEPLKEMGIKEAFTAKAQFGKMSQTPLMIDDVIQKTYIAVDEEGAEAAAATAVQMALTGLRPQEKKYITLDRPFIYAIKHNRSGEILFTGILNDPKEK